MHWLVQPERSPRLVLVHRPEGVMAYTHSHGCWVAIAPVRGAETHQHWNVVRHDGGRAQLSLADERVLHRGDVATLVPPLDVHNRGHVVGTGPAPYSLILLGDNMFVFDRRKASLRDLEAAEDDLARGVVLGSLGVLAAQEGEHAQARASFAEGLPLLRGANDLWDLARRVSQAGRRPRR